MSSRYRLHGVVVSSEIPLPEAPPAPADVAADVAFRFGAGREVPADADGGRVVARMPRTDGDGAFFTVVQVEGGGYTLRFHSVCDVVMTPDLRGATFHLDPRADRGLASVLASGLVLSILLTLRGHLVLHASAVEHDGRAIAVTGRSGMGKSTVSTLLCRAGARLITDDVLRVDLDGDGALCRVGAAETRLRPSAQDLLSPDDPVRRTSDGRTALALPRAALDPVPLRCVVVPYPDRGATEVTVQDVPRADALLLLAAYPRVVGWEDARTRGEQFLLAGDLVSRVPVVMARLPWGPPFPDFLGRDLLARLPT
jgi:hypothetical protein